MAEQHTVEAQDIQQDVETDEPTTQEANAVVPIPASLRQGAPRASFWRRISLLGTRSGLSTATGDDRLLARLDAIETRIESSGHELVERIRQLDNHVSEVWEAEEQLARLTELEQTLSDVRDRQGSIEGRLRGIGRRLSLIAILAAMAAAAALAALALTLV